MIPDTDTVYIAGPMTGYPNYNYDSFHAAAAKWRGSGWKVMNPAESFGGNQKLTYERYMRNAIRLVLKSRAVALLPGWEKSKGAQMEVLIASRMGYEFFDANTGQQLPTPHLTVGIIAP